MLFIPVIILLSVLLAIMLAACVSLALWLVFGRTNLFLRMPIFLAAVTLSAVLLALMDAKEGTHFVMFLTCAILIGAIMNCRPLIGKVVMGVMLAFIIAMAFCQPVLNKDRLEAALAIWIARSFFGTSLMAILFSLMRLTGFDVVRLLDGTNDLEIERRTGRCLDDWIKMLKNAKAEKWNRASLCRFLGNHGLDFSSQKNIAIAFEKVHGRRTVGTSLSGNAQIVAQKSDATDERKWFQKRSFEQVGIAQLLMLTFCAACFFRFAGLVYKNLTTLTDFAFAGPLPILVAIAVMTMLVHFLSVGSGGKKMLGFVFAGFLLLCLATFFAELRFGFYGVWNGLLALSIPFTFGISALLVQARHHGYRLVKVQQREVHTGEAPPESVYQLRRRLPNSKT